MEFEVLIPSASVWTCEVLVVSSVRVLIKFLRWKNDDYLFSLSVFR